MTIKHSEVNSVEIIPSIIATNVCAQTDEEFIIHNDEIKKSSYQYMVD